ncbi:SMI1/KNR4 family protein, partial [Streptomyces sp. DT225]
LEWLAEYTPPSYAALRPGASDEEMAELEAVAGAALPAELKALWRLSAGEDGVNGTGLMLGGWTLMPLDAVAEVHRRQMEVEKELGEDGPA